MSVVVWEGKGVLIWGIGASSLWLRGSSEGRENSSKRRVCGCTRGVDGWMDFDQEGGLKD